MRNQSFDCPRQGRAIAGPSSGPVNPTRYLS